ncbi:MAG: hypothetical protein O7A98_08850, partial [Acidobacteria bacterium]|nr:hypothetical protein [Acidobacteriota bacterium]
MSKGARALHLPGYYSPLPYASERGEIRRLRAADLLATGEDGGRVATGVLAAAFATGGSQADVLTIAAGIDCPPWIRVNPQT